MAFENAISVWLLFFRMIATRVIFLRIAYNFVVVLKPMKVEMNETFKMIG